MEKDLAAIWFQFGDKLKAFIVRKVQDDIVADDILQDVFIKLHANIDKLNDDTKIQPWIYQITRNAIVDHFRIIKKQNPALHYFFEDSEENSRDDVMPEAMGDMVKIMSDLPPENCEALCLTELEGMSRKAYAEKVGITYTAAKSRVQRSRKMLRDMLMRCCHYQFDKYGTVLEISPAKCCCCTSNHNP